MGRLIEGVWDCQYCDSKKIRGSIRVCPVCGRQRDNNIEFYMDNQHNYVDNETAKKVSRNPDWICSYCDALNSDDVDTCHICNASREDSEQNYFERRADIEARRAESKKTRESEYTESSRNDEIGQKNADENVEKTRLSAKKKTKKVNWRNIVKIGASVLAALMLIMCLVWVFAPKTQEVSVQGFSWERSINVEEYVTVERNDWNLPSDGRLLYTKQEIKTYEQVLDHYETKTREWTEQVLDHYETKTREYTEQVIDHYETYVSGYRDLGNGYFEEIESQRPVYKTETRTEHYQEPVYRTEIRTEEYQEPVYRSEPVYATKYYYEIDIWQHDYYSTSSGNDKDPYWNEVELKERQRENGRDEEYCVVVLNKKDEEKTYTFDFNTWNELECGEKIKIRTTIFGSAELVVDGEVVLPETENVR